MAGVRQCGQLIESRRINERIGGILCAKEWELRCAAEVGVIGGSAGVL